MRRSLVRSIDWTALSSKLTSDSAKAEVSRLRAVAGEIATLSNTYATAPPPIDFKAYKSKISAVEVVDSFEAEYSSVRFPSFVTKELADIKAKQDQLFADAEKSVAESKERIKVLSALIATMESNKVGPTTTLDQLYALDPSLQAEIEAEIDNHDWGKDI